MKNRKFIVGSALTIMVLAIAGIMFHASYSAKASTPSLSDVLSKLPSDCQFVFGMNVQKFVASPVYVKFKQKQSTQIGADLSQFIATTGVDPEHDIYYLVAAGRTQGKPKGQGVIIASGKFNKDVITAFIRSKSTPIATEYNGMQVLMVPEGKGNLVTKGIVFLNEQELALGDLEALKAVIDIRTKGNASLLSNARMASLTGNINPDEMFWFAGDGEGILANSPIPTPMGANIPSIQNIVGTFNITDSVTGSITATALDLDSATKLADAVRGLVAFGQLAGNQNPELQMLLGGLKVSQNSNQVSLALSFSAELLDKLDQAKKMAKPAARRL
jgi:hypothetical protein